MSSLPKEFVAQRYELLDIAGKGGMATVWRALAHGAAGFTRQVAVKRIKPEYQAIENYINMFVEEARVGSDLDHPHIVQVHDFIIDNKAYYLIMEWVEGVNLGVFVRGFLKVGMRTPWSLLTMIAIDALGGLAAAHERHLADGSAVPVIHRDVSPQNVLISVNGVTKLTDFGLARARDRVLSLTAPGTVKGKLNYLPPEVTYGQAATPMSDIFSMGNVLWECLAGRRLFRGSNDLDTFSKIRECNVPPLGELRPDVPEELAGVIHKALAREPALRYQSARAMARELVGVINDNGWSDDTRLKLGSAVMQVRSAAGITGDWLTRAEQEEPRWRSYLDIKRDAVDVVRSAGLFDRDGVNIEFSMQPKGVESGAKGAELADSQAASPAKKTEL